MCGYDNPNITRAGARADLYSQSFGALGNLIFLNPTMPDNKMATHVRFTPSAGSRLYNNMVISIHAIGDLTQSINDSGTFQKFSLMTRNANNGVLEMMLDHPVHLNVGGTGIIGRRISMMAGDQLDKGSLLADGIVGYNC